MSGEKTYRVRRRNPPEPSDEAVSRLRRWSTVSANDLRSSERSSHVGQLAGDAHSERCEAVSLWGMTAKH